MKFMSLLMTLLFSTSLFASGGGTYVGNGGHIIACFKKPPTNAFFEFGTLSWEGHQNLTLIEALDYYVAKRMLPDVHPLMSNFADIPDLVGLDEAQLRDKIHARFSLAGEPYTSQFNCLVKNLGLFKNGIRAENGLVSVNDLNLPLSPPASCQILQAVVRQRGFYYYNPILLFDLFLKSKSKVSQEGILQLHEDFYSFAHEVYGHTDSSQARNLLAFLLKGEPTAGELHRILRFFGNPVINACEH